MAKMSAVPMTTTLDTEAARRLALAQVAKDLRKEYGDDAVMFLEDAANRPVEVIRTGVVTLDLALGVGGLPRGRITELFGENGSGKSSLCFTIIAEAQALGLGTAFIDMEHAVDPAYIKRCGVNLSENGGMFLIQAMNGEQVFDYIATLCQSNAFGLIVVDSMAALIPKSEMEGSQEEDKSRIGAQANLISRGLLRIASIVERSNTAVIFTNQTRVDIGAFAGPGRTVTKTTGGRAPKFWAGVRIELKRGQHIKEGDRTIGHKVTATVVKNKTAPPFRKAEYEILFPNGIDKAGCVLDAAKTLDIVQTSGAHYSYKGERLGMGRDNVRDLLRGRPALVEEIAQAIYNATDVSKVIVETEPRPEEL